MTMQEFQALLPLIVLGAAATMLVALVSWRRGHARTAGVTLAALAAALVLLVRGGESVAVGTLMVMDGQARLFGAMVIAAAFFSALLVTAKGEGRAENKEEFHILLLLATLGAVAMAASVHLVSFFVSLELLSVSLYAMIAYDRTPLNIEAALKYLVLAGASSATLLFGLAVIYAFGGYDSHEGTMNLSRLGGYFSWADKALGDGRYLKHFFPMLAGLALVLTGIGFKLALVPFHLWTADVYQGAPAPATAFVATASKGAALAFLLRMFGALGLQSSEAVNLALVVAAVASMIAGNVLALWQHNLKRVLAYSSVAHMGYVLVALLSAGGGATAAGFYLVAYFVSVLGAMAVVTALDVEGDDRRGEGYRGLFFQHPALAVMLALMMLSLAGLPITAGFMGKLLVLRSGLSAGQWTLAITLILTSAVGLCYYVRIALAVFHRDGRDEDPLAPPDVDAPLATNLTAWTMSALLLAIGVLPAPLMRWVSSLLGK